MRRPRRGCWRRALRAGPWRTRCGAALARFAQTASKPQTAALRTPQRVVRASRRALGCCSGPRIDAACFCAAASAADTCAWRHSCFDAGARWRARPPRRRRQARGRCARHLTKSSRTSSRAP
jgi:hypothetical protein